MLTSKITCISLGIDVPAAVYLELLCNIWISYVVTRATYSYIFLFNAQHVQWSNVRILGVSDIEDHISESSNKTRIS